MKRQPIDAAFAKWTTRRKSKTGYGDVRDVLGEGWDLMIAHPPCEPFPLDVEWR